MCFFFFLSVLAHFTHYTDEIAHITIQKEMGREKHPLWTAKFQRWFMFCFFFSLFIFSQGGEPELKGDRKKRFTKSQSAKGCIFNNFCGFSVTYYKL